LTAESVAAAIRHASAVTRDGRPASLPSAEL
jgi:hypothetical protein